MKQYTTQHQTAKLVELGFKPESIEFASDCEVVNEYGIERIECTNPQFSIGELLSFLPKSIKVNDCYFTLTISAEFDNWLVEYVDIAYGSQAYVSDVELIDTLFAEIVQLKEEGVI